MMLDKQSPALELEFARQLRETCLERHGRDHEQTRLVLGYTSALEDRDSNCTRAEKQTFPDSENPKVIEDTQVR
jgi:hypothetical protein